MQKLLIDATELSASLPARDRIIFDVRYNLADPGAGRRAYEEGHIPSALFLDQEDDLAGEKTGRNGRHPLPDQHDFAALMRAQGLRKRSQVVIYDDGSGGFAARLWWMLRWLGHENVAILDGGWPAWVAAGGEVETGVNQPRLTEAQAVEAISVSAAPAMPTVSVDEVAANLETQALTLVDARAAERYAGKVEPLDPVAGHIPGALNRPSSENMEAGRFKSPDQLKKEFEALLEGRRPDTIVHQCGSGITACHNLFAMELAGLSGSALYPGSWSEWCSDPDRPVARKLEHA